MSILTDFPNNYALSTIKLLNKLGVKPNLKGYVMLAFSICYKYEDQDLPYKVIYSKVADKMNVSPQCVERNIRTAIGSAYNNNSETFNEIFPFTKSKPYASEFISKAVLIINNPIYL